jgi:hypothetical protein
VITKYGAEPGDWITRKALGSYGVSLWKFIRKGWDQLSVYCGVVLFMQIFGSVIFALWSGVVYANLVGRLRIIYFCFVISFKLFGL